MQLTYTGSRYHLAIHCSKILPNEMAQLTFEFRSSLFSRPFVEAMARSFAAALIDVVACDNQKSYAQINYLSVIDEALVDEWSKPSPLLEWMDKTCVQEDGVLLHQVVESASNGDSY